MEKNHTQDVVPQIASALAANLSQEERAELDAAITPRVAELFAQAFGSQMWDILAPLVEEDDLEFAPEQPDSADAGTGNTDAAEARLRELMRDPRYWRDRDPSFVAKVAAGFDRLYAGTPHSYYTIYADASRAETGETAPFLAGFERLELPLLDARGHSRWPKRFDAAAIASLRERHGPNKFASQMMLRPVNISAGRLDPERMRVYDSALQYQDRNGTTTLSLEGRRLVSASCWWDPAYGAPGKGDGSVVALVFTDTQGRYWLHRLRYLGVDPADECDEATQQCRQVAAFARRYYVPSVTIETNGVGKFLPGLLRRELGVAGVGCAVVEAASHVPKDRRIMEGFDAVLAAGNLYAHRTVWETPFDVEMREWRPGGYKGPDDGLDAVSGCLRSEPVRLPRIPAGARQSWRGHPGGIKVETNFKL